MGGDGDDTQTIRIRGWIHTGIIGGNNPRLSLRTIDRWFI